MFRDLSDETPSALPKSTRRLSGNLVDLRRSRKRWSGSPPIGSRRRSDAATIFVVVVVVPLFRIQAKGTNSDSLSLPPRRRGGRDRLLQRTRNTARIVVVDVRRRKNRQPHRFSSRKRTAFCLSIAPSLDPSRANASEHEQCRRRRRLRGSGRGIFVPRTSDSRTRGITVVVVADATAATVVVQKDGNHHRRVRRAGRQKRPLRRPGRRHPRYRRHHRGRQALRQDPQAGIELPVLRCRDLGRSGQGNTAGLVPDGAPGTPQHQHREREERRRWQRR
mmetsp:Transcript_25283/g.53910  ORF Transcript_25283/g.53910 Transcript_25283/m.53910 type:complete len:277 (+) Transcript_25283:200-1030(+)